MDEALVRGGASARDDEAGLGRKIGKHALVHVLNESGSAMADQVEQVSDGCLVALHFESDRTVGLVPNPAGDWKVECEGVDGRAETNTLNPAGISDAESHRGG